MYSLSQVEILYQIKQLYLLSDAQEAARLAIPCGTDRDEEETVLKVRSYLRNRPNIRQVISLNCEVLPVGVFRFYRKYWTSVYDIE